MRIKLGRVINGGGGDVGTAGGAAVCIKGITLHFNLNKVGGGVIIWLGYGECAAGICRDTDDV